MFEYLRNGFQAWGWEEGVVHGAWPSGFWMHVSSEAFSALQAHGAWCLPSRSFRLKFTCTWTRGPDWGLYLWRSPTGLRPCTGSSAKSEGKCPTLLPAPTVPGLCVLTVCSLPQLADSWQDPLGVEVQEGSQPWVNTSYMHSEWVSLAVWLSWVWIFLYCFHAVCSWASHLTALSFHRFLWEVGPIGCTSRGSF